jgi:hypothetical protein
MLFEESGNEIMNSDTHGWMGILLMYSVLMILGCSLSSIYFLSSLGLVRSVIIRAIQVSLLFLPIRA